MVRLIGLGLVACALCVTRVAADEDVYDGPTAIRPLTVTPQPQRSAQPNTVCDFEHQCYPKKGGPRVQAPGAPPVVAATPPAPRLEVPDEPIVATWRSRIGRALQNYEQSHDVHALQAATASCQARLEEQGGEDYAGEEPSTRRRRPRLMADGTSAAVGGPSAAMPIATVLLGAGPSDDRKRTPRGWLKCHLRDICGRDELGRARSADLIDFDPRSYFLDD
jgi:hypothetical protein